MTASANALTLETYGRAMDRWREASCEDVHGGHLAFLEQVVALVPPGARVLEIGSGTGRDAGWLESRGLVVQCTDGCPEFVEALRSTGRDAHVLNVLEDPIPRGFDVVWASAVLLHLEAADLPGVLTRIAGAAPLLAFTVKVGEGSEWSTAKTGLPRFFQFWQEDSMRDVLAGTPWRIELLEQRPGRYDEWLQVVCGT